MMRKILLPCIFIFLLNDLNAQQNIYISSRNTNSVKRYDTLGNFQSDFVVSGSGGLNAPQDLLFHLTQPLLLITGANNDYIKSYDASTGAYIGDFSSGYILNSPTKMKIGQDSLIYVSQWQGVNSKVVRFDLNGNFVDEFTKLFQPWNASEVDWDINGNLYVVSHGNGLNGNIRKYDTLGNYINSPISSTHLDGPTNIWQRNNQWYIADWTQGKVKQFDSTLTYQGDFISGFTNVEGYAFDNTGRLYLCDWSQNHVKRFLPNGQFDTLFITTGGLVAPNAIVFGPDPQTTALIEAELDFPLIGPNPFNDFIKIKSFSSNQSITKVSIFDSKGHIVYQKKYRKKLQTLRIETSHLKIGSYMMKLVFGNSKSNTFKLVKL